jgi:hypothetical protein
MDGLILSRWQFGVTTIYHFFFVSLTLGLFILVALTETLYVRRGDESYKRMAQFWGKLFLINFAMVVVTGIVRHMRLQPAAQERQCRGVSPLSVCRPGRDRGWQPAGDLERPHPGAAYGTDTADEDGLGRGALEQRKTGLVFAIHFR